ncbi:hypothetical protein M431DRAFT_385925 [Trichoderma harzianum CBS 226.95]|jgi:hypothetical protein|uniref:Uncharacterized protein n=1 Tax=Trichoderma harzianum CBS 226.95 TaxID=983964 RepID=A0A2T4AI37_TRIHA|nr:hypothetical protein M431DRAFT_385925 [Trichoderma harzianum CBS 226.95]PTB56754.1 hypothetical protein M431DRAFT_385925 [Trichoderma harzianum CBS 226.95]
MTPSFARANGAFPDEQRTKTDLPAFGGAVAASPLFRHVKVQIRDAKAVRFFLFLWPSSRDRDPWKRLGRPCVLLSMLPCIFRPCRFRRSFFLCTHHRKSRDFALRWFSRLRSPRTWTLPLLSLPGRGSPIGSLASGSSLVGFEPCACGRPPPFLHGISALFREPFVFFGHEPCLDVSRGVSTQFLCRGMQHGYNE